MVVTPASDPMGHMRYTQYLDGEGKYVVEPKKFEKRSSSARKETLKA